MKYRTTFVWIPALAIFALLATGCTPDPTEGQTAARINEPKVESTAEEGTEATAEPVVEDVDSAAWTTYAISDMSTIGFEGSKAVGTHVGGFSKHDGTIQIKDGDLSTARIEITIDMTSTYSDDSDLTANLIGPNFFDIEKFPTASFKSTGVEKTADGFDVSGDFTLRGVTHNITIPAKMEFDGDAIWAEAVFSVNRRDWGIVYDGLADNAIREGVLLTLGVIAEKQD